MSGRWVYGLGGIALGLVGLGFADFALQWQSVPKDIPFHTPLAYLSGAVLLLGGLALFVRGTAALGAAVLAANFLLWSALHIPAVIAHPANFAAWLGPFEPLAIAAGGLVAFAGLAPLGAEASARLSRLGRTVFALTLPVFGASHFAYLAFTAAMVPKWLPPGQMFWAAVTGAAHIAAGLALLAGVQARLAAWLLTLMFAAFTLVLHAPLVASDPKNHLDWCMFGVTLAMTGAAWSVAEATPRKGR